MIVELEFVCMVPNEPVVFKDSKDMVQSDGQMVHCGCQRVNG